MFFNKQRNLANERLTAAIEDFATVIASLTLMLDSAGAIDKKRLIAFLALVTKETKALGEKTLPTEAIEAVRYRLSDPEFSEQILAFPKSPEAD